ncbi:MAG: MFS transporter [Solirubrobacteraceae bacterium]
MRLLASRFNSPVGISPSALARDLRGLPRGVWVLAGGSFINSFGVLVLPFLTLYLVRRGYTTREAGAAVLLYGVGKLAAAPLGGYLADRIGPRRATALSMFASAGSMLALWRVHGLPAIYAVAAIAGLTSELYRPSTTALLSAIVDQERRLSAFGLYALATNAGLAAGPAVGGLLASHSFGALFVIDAVSSTLCGAIALRALPETQQSARWPRRPGSALRAIARDRLLLRFLLALTLANVVLFQAQTTLPLWVRKLGFSTAVYGALLAANSGLNAALQLPVSTISRRFAPRLAIATGCALIAVGFALTGLAHSIVLLFAVLLIWTLGELINWPVGAAYVASLASKELVGRYAGARSLTFALGLVIAPIIGTNLLTWSPVALWSFCLLAGLLAAALAITIPAEVTNNHPSVTADQHRGDARPESLAPRARV